MHLLRLVFLALAPALLVGCGGGGPAKPEGYAYTPEAAVARLIQLNLNESRGAEQFRFAANAIEMKRKGKNNVRWTVKSQNKLMIIAKVTPVGDKKTATRSKVDVEVIGRKDVISGDAYGNPKLPGTLAEKIASWLERRPFDDEKVATAKVKVKILPEPKPKKVKKKKGKGGKKQDDAADAEQAADDAYDEAENTEE